MNAKVTSAPTLLFHCAVSPSIGYGHLSRCLSLADAARSVGYESIFVTVGQETLPADLVTSRGHRVNNELETEDPLPAMQGVASSHAVKWVVVDSYAVNPTFLNRSAEIAPLVVMEDQVDRDLTAASMVVCLAPQCEQMTLQTRTDAIVLAGTRYALVAEEFTRRRPTSLVTREFHPRVERIAVALGATDSTGYMPDVLAAVGQWAGVEVRVAGEVGYETRALPDNVTLKGFLSGIDMADLMMWSDLFIASASTLTWELATLGIPAAFVVTATNQGRIGRYLEMAGVPVADSRGQIDALLTPSRWTSDSRRELSEKMAGLSDGQGAGRVARRLQS
jgi:spore coat polysaccharide biosynthesis predicted glycosyltransferase SpsG